MIYFRCGRVKNTGSPNPRIPDLFRFSKYSPNMLFYTLNYDTFIRRIFRPPKNTALMLLRCVSSIETNFLISNYLLKDYHPQNVCTFVLDISRCGLWMSLHITREISINVSNSMFLLLETIVLELLRKYVNQISESQLYYYIYLHPDILYLVFHDNTLIKIMDRAVIAWFPVLSVSKEISLFLVE